MSALLPAPGKQKRIIANAARRAGISPALLWGVYGAETDFGRNLSTSGAGAVGPFQFMPATARGMGIDPLNFRQAAFGAARYLSQYKGRGVAGMLAAYNAGPAGDPSNPETRAYIPRVQQLARSWNGPDPTAGGGGGGGGGRAVSGPLGLQTTSPDGSALTALLAGMRQERPQIQSAGLAPPAFSAAAPMPKGYQAPAAGSAAPAASSSSPLADALQQIAGTAPGSSRVTGQAPATGLRPAGGGGRAGPGPDAALQFASKRLGISETAGANRGPLIDRWEQSFGMLGQPWCGIFVGKALQRAGVRVDSRIASTAAIVQMARAGDGGFAGLVGERAARRGDVVVWNPGSGGHTGIVERRDRDGSLVVIEGNASNGVRRRVHPSQGAYYARPAYPGVRSRSS